MNAGEECVGCDPILPRMIFMRGWTDVFMMPWWGRRREGMPNGQKIRVLGVSVEWMREDTKVRPYDASVWALL